jgi:hypothetical protein
MSQPTTVLNAETKLFHLVRNWMKVNPGALIPIDSWVNKIESYKIPSGEQSIMLGQYEYRLKRVALIVALAAVSLDTPKEVLARILQHHDLKFSDIDLIKAVSRQDLAAEDTQQTRITPPVFIYEFVQGLLLIEEQRDQLLQYRAKPVLTMPLLGSDDREFWPITHIEDRERTHKAGQPYDQPNPQQIRAEYFHVCAGQRDPPDDAMVRELVRRAGYLSPAASLENFCPNAFFAEVLEMASEGKDKNSLMVLGAINSVEDPAERQMFADKIISSLSNLKPNSTSGEKLAASILPLLDPVKYADVVDSVVLRINLLEWPMSPGDITSKFQTLDDQTLFRDLASEIMALPADRFEGLHFRCLCQFAKHWKDAHHATDVDVNELVIHVTKGLTHFLNEPRWVKWNQPQVSAMSKAEVFLRFASKLKPDYDKLNVLSSEMKTMLCKNGYRIKYFTGMTHQDKGKVLNDDLGL